MNPVFSGYYHDFTDRNRNNSCIIAEVFNIYSLKQKYKKSPCSSRIFLELDHSEDFQDEAFPTGRKKNIR
jgi:hypothetical protein